MAVSSRVWVLACLPVLACGGPGLVPVSVDDDVGSEPEKQLQLTVNKDVDILFVIDNSGSMGEEQANLAANFGAMIQVLEADDVEANYRIGVTTTDNGNPWCPAGTTTPESGKLVASSCRGRLGEFLFGDTEDLSQEACLDICEHEQIDLLPTTTDYDPTPTPRPWLENIEGKTNLPEGISAAAAFACLAPQGINGCGFESPLESMYLALARSEEVNEASHGFLRRSAVLAVIFVTDEADCSYNKDWAAIFTADGDKVFWSDPNESFPTSAVCWNAGVACHGDPSSYDGCDPVDLDIAGDPTSDPDAAVLHPLARYLDRLQEIEDLKQEYNAEQEVIVALIGGVDEGGAVFYADGSDPEFLHDFGVGPGCVGDNGEAAVPPVRLRAFTEAFTSDSLFSVCGSDYTGPLQVIAERVRDQIQPACYGSCALDTNPDTAALEPSCIVEEYDGQTPTALVECARDGEGGPYLIDPVTNDYAMPGADINACFALLVDPGDQTGDVNDDMSDACVEQGLNLEFKIARRPGFPAPGGVFTKATCKISEQPGEDCPGL